MDLSGTRLDPISVFVSYGVVHSISGQPHRKGFDEMGTYTNSDMALQTQGSEIWIIVRFLSRHDNSTYLISTRTSTLG